MGALSKLCNRINNLKLIFVTKCVPAQHGFAVEQIF